MREAQCLPHRQEGNRGMLGCKWEGDGCCGAGEVREGAGACHAGKGVKSRGCQRAGDDR